MHRTVLAVILTLPMSAPAAFAAPADCARSAAIVTEAVEAREAGQSRGAVEARLSERLDPSAGTMLAEWIWSLPEAQLGPDIGEAWRRQCEAAN